MNHTDVTQNERIALDVLSGLLLCPEVLADSMSDDDAEIVLTDYNYLDTPAEPGRPIGENELQSFLNHRDPVTTLDSVRDVWLSLLWGEEYDE